jgi:septal ring factor EnvC (AmiA/AmiB activator)
MAEESKLVDKLEKESKEIKFTDEELTQLRQIQQDYVECQTAFGQVAIQKIGLQQQIDALAKSEEEYAKKYQETQVKEKEVATELNDKYGSGNLDPQTGVFTPNS